MILGIGVDLVDIARIEKLYARRGVQFANRILSDRERHDLAVSAKPILFLASRFAAKEALSKALGTGMRFPVTFHAISVCNNVMGKPEFEFHGALPESLAARGVARQHLSLTHEKGFACAMVVVED
ncbi:MAG: holo-ACP synthase [Burkholderiales bacterium]